MDDGLDWLPPDGAALSCDDLARIFRALRALIAGTSELEPNRAYAVEIAVVIARAVDESGGQDG